MAPSQPHLSTAVAGARSPSLLSPVEYDADAVSIRSDQDSDSEDDELQLRARSSGELRAHDRMVFLEEDEMDRLVTDARRREQQADRGRRGSGLAQLANPLRFLGVRRGSRSPGRPENTSSASLASADTLLGDSGEGREAERAERRRQRRQRRQEKKQRLLARAQQGADGELMYEMEEGGIKEGSSTGESSEREDGSDEAGQQLLGGGGGTPKANTRRRCSSRLLVHALIAVAFALLVLGAWKATLDKKHRQQQTKLTSNGTALFLPTTLIISLDGFRADFLQRGLTPRLSALVREGVSPPHMLPSFPSVTFPNHYTLATGLYPESHGLVGNTFWDPALEAEFFYTDPARSLDPKWWGGEPFWVTAEKAGVRTAVHMWPGSEAHIQGLDPTYVDRFSAKEPLDNKVARVLEFLDKPGPEAGADANQRPQLIAAYVPNVDADGHRYGPNSTEIRATIQAVDAMLDRIVQGLEARNLTDIVNVIVVSDHGMATTDVTRLLQLEDLVGDDNMARVAHVDGWPLVGLRPRLDDGRVGAANLDTLYEAVRARTRDNPNVDVYRRDVDMPARYHFSRNPRIAPLWLVPKTGWSIVQRAEFDVAEGLANGLVYHPRGLHGYDHEHPLMRAIFIARGPAFPHAPNSRLDVFQNIEVYNLLCDSLGLEPKPNNGTLRLPLQPAGLHGEPPEEPADPVTSYTLTATETATVGVDVPEMTVGTAETVQTTATATSVETTPTTSTTPTAQTTTATSAETTPTSTTPTSTAPSATPTEDASLKDAVHHFWDWLTDKIGDAWDKITGSKNKSDA